MYMRNVKLIQLSADLFLFLPGHWLFPLESKWQILVGHLNTLDKDVCCKFVIAFSLFNLKYKLIQYPCVIYCCFVFVVVDVLFCFLIARKNEKGGSPYQLTSVLDLLILCLSYCFFYPTKTVSMYRSWGDKLHLAGCCPRNFLHVAFLKWQHFHFLM